VFSPIFQFFTAALLKCFYKGKKTNSFLQADWLYAETLNKNEFVTGKR